MWTPWYSAGVSQQVDQSQIGHVKFGTASMISILPVKGLHMGRNQLLIFEPNALIFKNFGFNIQLESSVVKGCETRIISQRLGRIEDRVIQLCFQDQALGQNRAVSSATDRQTYGHEQDLWGLENFQHWNNSEFGIMIDLTPSLTTPSSNLSTIYSVDMRLNVVDQAS